MGGKWEGTDWLEKKVQFVLLSLSSLALSLSFPTYYEQSNQNTNSPLKLWLAGTLSEVVEAVSQHTCVDLPRCFPEAIKVPCIPLTLRSIALQELGWSFPGGWITCPKILSLHLLLFALFTKKNPNENCKSLDARVHIDCQTLKINFEEFLKKILFIIFLSWPSLMDPRGYGRDSFWSTITQWPSWLSRVLNPRFPDIILLHHTVFLYCTWVHQTCVLQTKSCTSCAHPLLYKYRLVGERQWGQNRQKVGCILTFYPEKDLKALLKPLSLSSSWPCVPSGECLRRGDQPALGDGSGCGEPLYVGAQGRRYRYQASLLLPVQGKSKGERVLHSIPSSTGAKAQLSKRG